MSKVSTPFQKRGVLILNNFILCHVLVPLGPSRDLQRLVLRVVHTVDELAEHGRIVVCAIDYGCLHLDLMSSDALRLEFLLRHFSELHELFERVLFKHGCQLRLGLALNKVRGMLKKVRNKSDVGEFAHDTYHFVAFLTSLWPNTRRLLVLQCFAETRV